MLTTYFERMFAVAVFIFAFGGQSQAEDREDLRLDDEVSAQEAGLLSEELANDEFEQYACWRYDRRPAQCRYTYGCFYNYRTNRCIASDYGGNWYTCTARDRGWEEHWGGHRATARTRWQAERRALLQCQREHGRCYISYCNIRY